MISMRSMSSVQKIGMLSRGDRWYAPKRSAFCYQKPDDLKLPEQIEALERRFNFTILLGFHVKESATTNDKEVPHNNFVRSSYDDCGNRTNACCSCCKSCLC